MVRMILASSSPRRQELLQLITNEYEIVTADIDESKEGFTSPQSYVAAMAERKAQRVAANHPEAIVIGADTIVVKDEILGKPKNKEEARQMLEKLSGQEHEVYTAVCICNADQKIAKTVKTKVRFFPLSAQEIEDYLAKDEYLDKAGAYGIQGAASLFVESITGDYFNIVGFPVASVARMLSALQ